VPNIVKNPIIIGSDTLFSDENFAIIAGPCAVEDEQSLIATAELLRNHNVKMLRGGVNKMRTSPHSFQGLGESAAKMLASVATEYGLYTVSEITCLKEIDLIERYIHIALVGTRNMQNTPLLKELGKLQKPVILKRGMAATVKEWLLAAEYISLNGNDRIILCERGIRTFEQCTRYTLDLASAVFVNQNYPYHVITDPSHATGNSSLVPPMVMASLAAGVQGCMIEIHPTPGNALCDGEQMLNFAQFETLMNNI